MTQPIVSPRVYAVVCAALLVLTLTTTWVAFYDLGPWNTVVAITITVCKATLVVLFFMHARYTSARLTWVFLGAGLVWLAILIVLTLSDVSTRDWLAPPPPPPKEEVGWQPCPSAAVRPPASCVSSGAVLGG